MLFEAHETERVSRRAYLFAPFALAGLAAMVYRKPRPLPGAAIDGNGAPVTLTLFLPDGRRGPTISVRKLIRSDAEWRSDLTPAEFATTRRAGTEFAFDNVYWNCHLAGLYRCVCCGNALFRSEDKFDSDTGWPSFRQPCAPENVYARPDRSLNILRTEVLCTKCDAHLGHVFGDGPPPTGLRYCVNSVALRFQKYS